MRKSVVWEDTPRSIKLEILGKENANALRVRLTYEKRLLARLKVVYLLDHRGRGEEVPSLNRNEELNNNL